MPVVQVVVSAGDVELAADALWQADPSAVSEEPLGDGTVRLTADVRDPQMLDPRWSASVLEVDGDAYLDAWRRWARPVRAGDRIVVHPAWLEPGPTAAGEIRVLVDPGRTFGSGSHPSTVLSLELVEAHLVPGGDVLDVGCGSGVLSAAAALLGARTVRAIDIDPSAVEATRANALRNEVADRVTASTEPITDLRDRYGLVVANIGAGVLVDLARPLVARVAAGGVLVLAGLLDEQADDVVAAFPELRELHRRHLDGWAAVALRHPFADGPPEPLPPRKR